MAAKTLPDQITDLLIALIYTGKLVPGDKLPPERQLAEHLGVDRTSLRMALRTLTRMNVIHAVQGSGIRVLDYRREGGIDFLSNLYRIEELEPGREFMLSVIELFNRALPAAIRLLMARDTDQYKGRLLEIAVRLRRELQNDASLSDLAAVEVELVEVFLSSTGNIFMQVAGGSSRWIRQLLTEKIYSTIDVRAHLNWLSELIMDIHEDVLSTDEIIRRYGDYMDGLSSPLKAHLDQLPAEPILNMSPLRNGKHIMDLDDIMNKRVVAMAESEF